MCVREFQESLFISIISIKETKYKDWIKQV